MKVIALGLELTDSSGELSRVKSKPPELQEFRPKQFAEEYKRLMDGEDQDDSGDDESSGDDDDVKEAEKESSDEEESERVKQRRRGRKNQPEGMGFDDGFTQVKEKKHGDRRNHIKPKIKEEIAQREVKEEKVEEV